MSKAYYFIKNFNWAEVKNLLCYSTKHPEVLTHNQKITRLYRSSLRRMFAHKLEGYKTDFGDYNEAVNQIAVDFQNMMELKPESQELETYIKKYEQLQEDLFDPSMLIDDCRPYAPTSARYFIWGDEALERDPFGYYKPRLMSDSRPDPNLPYFEDYPMNDSHWNIWETFPEHFDDADHAGEQIRSKNEQVVDELEKTEKKFYDKQ